MDVLKRMKRCAQFLGLGDKDKASLRLLACVLVAAIVISNVVGFLIDRWNDLHQRIVALKAFLFLFAIFNYFLMLSFNWRHISPMLDLFRGASIKVPYPVSVRRNHLLYVLESKVTRLNNWWSRMLGAYVAASLPIPLIIVAVKVTLRSADLQNILKDPLSAPFPLYYPQYIKRSNEHQRLFSVIFYGVGYAMHSICVLYMGVCCLLVNVSTLSALLYVEYELKLLSLSLAEMDDMVEKSSHFHDTIGYDELRRFCRYIARHHQQTYRKFEVAAKGVSGVGFTFGFFNAFYTCLSIFTIVKQNQIMLKLQELLYTSIWIFGIFLYDDSGERARTEHDNLRNVVYGCTWQEKPEWFKKTILLMLARTCRPLDVKALGIFGFNLNSFATRINAAYCYYNVLCNFK